MRSNQKGLRSLDVWHVLVLPHISDLAHLCESEQLNIERKMDEALIEHANSAKKSHNGAVG